jgi:hypothetical protein
MDTNPTDPTGPTGPRCTVAQYQAALTDPEWVAQQAALQAPPGHWTTASLDMFMHFARLAALGPTDADIAWIYDYITQRDPRNPNKPVLDNTGFPDITPTTWRNYRGYLQNSIDTWITWGDLNVQNIGVYMALGGDTDPDNPSRAPVVHPIRFDYADLDFLARYTPYYHDP